MHTTNEVPNIKDLESIKPNCKAVLWDMDGTIMKTESLHAKAVHEILITHNKNCSLSAQNIEDQCCGETDHFVFEKYKRENYLEDLSFSQFCSLKEDSIKSSLKKTQPSEIFNSAIKNYMQDLHQKGIKQAVVTSSEKSVTKMLLDYLELGALFDFIITREDTKQNKPSPAPYLLALKKLDLKGQNVLIYEDSKVGLAAANQSNATVCQAKWYH